MASPPHDKTPIHHAASIDIAELGRLVRRKRAENNLSVRQAADQANVSFSTLSRVEGGAQPDLTTFLNLCAWLEVEPSRLFPSVVDKPEDTLDEVTRHLTSDPRLSPGAAERIVSVVRDMYSALARKDLPTRATVALHLRAASVMRPGTPQRLAELLTDMHAALEQQLGSHADDSSTRF